MCWTGMHFLATQKVCTTHVLWTIYAIPPSNAVRFSIDERATASNHPPSRHLLTASPRINKMEPLERNAKKEIVLTIALGTKSKASGRQDLTYAQENGFR